VSIRSPTVLERILAETREEVTRRKRDSPLEELSRDWAHGPAPDEQGQRRTVAERAPTVAGHRHFRDALARPDIGVIAEFKRRSPSAGALREHPDLVEIVRAYERGGAVALSVLTEGPNFDGSLEDLRAARAACDLPILRKDFIVDPYQLHEARAAGADAVLLIVAALGPGELESLNALAHAMGLDVLVEVHDDEELQSALSQGADLVGINNRDLRDFSVDMERTMQLMGEIPPSVTVVSESGIATAEHLDRLRRAGVHAVLVGEALMRAPDPEAALRALQIFPDTEAGL
jgi:indole-3-glycerol phosphate synthase